MRPPTEQKQQSSAQQGRAALPHGFPHSETRKIRDPDLLKNVRPQLRRIRVLTYSNNGLCATHADAAVFLDVSKSLAASRHAHQKWGRQGSAHPKRPGSRCTARG